MSGVPYTFGNATTTIALSNLDTNFATPVTIGNTSVALGNTTTTVGNLTVSNVTINGLSGGGANGVVYINSSNTATANASVLAFDGSNLGLGVTPSTWSGFVALQNKSASMAVTSNGNNVDYSVNRYNNGTNDIFYQTGNYALIYEQASGSGAHRWYTSTAAGTAGGTISFTQAMTLDNSGNWYLGTTGTITGFYGSQAQVYANNTNGINLAYNGSGQSGINIWGQYASGTIYFQLYYGGAAGSRGQVGSITYNGTVMALNTGSDRRLKSNITNITNSGEFIDSLTPRAFTWTAQNVNDYGFIADEFQNVRPNDVIGEANAVDSDGKPVYQQANFNSPAMIAMLVAEIQSLRARLKAANIA